MSGHTEQSNEHGAGREDVSDVPVELRRKHHDNGGSKILVIVGAILIVMVGLLWWEGRRLWCECGQSFLLAGDVNSSHNSQHLFDWYSLSHLLHGVFFYWIFKGVWKGLLRRKWVWGYGFAAAMLLEAGWEVLENSQLVIDRYREATAALGYSGDSIVNSGGDMFSCAVGFIIAGLIGWRMSVVVFLAVELLMLWLVKDNLILNVLMLIYPIEAIKEWQIAPVSGS
ncbi:DUF2585 family protein [Poriferisphaera sp. WC338]|uniref:DUF2585 family protein n=1 Tax=Poriferisphaera sp. WC338 TaxID=3425129 RepID=UPI003D819DEF